jgi:hypothetical protein
MREAMGSQETPNDTDRAPTEPCSGIGVAVRLTQHPSKPWHQARRAGRG